MDVWGAALYSSDFAMGLRSATLTRATAVRFSTERMLLALRRRVAEWQVDGQWRRVSLTPLAGA
jgi:hypothetical protein